MNYDLSDDEFCETNFAVPSPIKKRSALLPEPKELKMKLQKLSDLNRQMNKTEAELLLFLTNEFNKSGLVKNADCDVFQVGEEIKLRPDGRPFFKEDSLEASLRLSNVSTYNGLTRERMCVLVRRGFLRLKNLPAEELKTLIKYCLELLKVENDYTIKSFLLEFLVTEPLSYDMVNLREWDSPSSFLELLKILERSVHRYSPKECQHLFREGCLAALDKRLLFDTLAIRSFLTACLEVSTKEYPVSEELDWLIHLNLQPEECTHLLLEVLPESDNSRLKFAFKVLHYILQSSDDYKGTSPQDLASLLRVNESKLCVLSLTAVHHSMIALYFIIQSMPAEEKDQAHLEDIVKCMEDFKLKLSYREKGPTYNVHLLTESINRFCLSVQQRLQLSVKQCRKKLFMPES